MIAFNTHRTYTEHGQRVVASSLVSGKIAFIDYDRGVSGTSLEAMKLTQTNVMAFYDSGKYRQGLPFNTALRNEMDLKFKATWKPEKVKGKYQDNPYQFYKDMMEASEYIMSFNLMNFDSPKQQEAWSRLVYALGCKFSEEGTTREQDVVLKTAAEATKNLV